MPPMACGCRDPLSCYCHDDPPPIDTQADERAELLADLRTLWRISYRDLAERLARWLGAR